MLSKIKLKFGTTQGATALEIPLTSITIFVGPNNSGKSRVLVEIEKQTREIAKQYNTLILDDIDFQNYSREEIEEELTRITIPNGPDVSLPESHITIGKLSPQRNKIETHVVPKESLIQTALSDKKVSGYYNYFTSLYTLRLDGTNRLNLLNQQQAGDLLSMPINQLAHLFKNDPLRGVIRRIIFEAIGRYFVIDPTNMGYLRVRLSDSEPKTVRQEKGWEEESVTFHGKALEIENASDGVKAFVGIITTLLAGDPKVTLIDEPEAFLHPALASKLGKEIGRALKDEKKRLFVATHSASFLMGCIQSGAPINIIRLTYKGGQSTARLLPQERILHLMRNPLLRSTSVLNGIFYEAVVVTESDSDRAFYQEVNERLLSENDPRGINDCLFINAQNKQTVWDIVKPLRELGIPTAGVVDVDILKDGGKEFGKVLSGGFFPDLMYSALEIQRKNLKDALDGTKKNWKTEGGLETLTGGDKESGHNFLDQLASHGVFAVRNGELESWLKHLGVARKNHGPSWLLEMFTRLGEDPSDAQYIKPDKGDVWDFMGAVKEWLDNPNRKGIPS